MLIFYSATMKSTAIISFLVFIISAAGVTTCPTGCYCQSRAIQCRGLASLPPKSSLDNRLRKLNFSGGNIREIPSGYFSRFKNAEIIDLSNNDIDTLGSRAFQGMHRIRLLDLSNNKIAVIPSHALSEISGPTSCAISSLGLQCRLILTGNDLTSIEANSLSWVKRLEIVISGSGDLNIASYAFYGSRNIPVIRISNFNSIHMRKRVFTNTENVGRVEVMNTKLHSILPFNFEGLKNVDTLQFHGVHFAEIEDFGFSGIHYSLRQSNASYFILNSSNSDKIYTAPDAYPLVFNNSELLTIPTDCFQDTNLESVLFLKNRINRIEEYAFRGLLDLKLLTLTNNTIIQLDEGALGELRSTNEIVMHDNHMGTLTSKAFHNTQGLRLLSIRIRPNQNLHLGSAAFSGIQEVDLLTISGSPGMTSRLSVAPDAFHAMGGVVEMRISHVTLPVLKQDAFRGITKVGVLKFEHCNISRVEHTAFGQENRPGTVYALDLRTGNNFVCNCDLNDMLRDFERMFVNFEISCKDKHGREKVITANSKQWADCHKSVRATFNGGSQIRTSFLTVVIAPLAVVVTMISRCKLSLT